LRTFEDSYMWLLAREQGEFEYVAEPLAYYFATDFTNRGDKSEVGRHTFIRLVRQRYGRSAEPLVGLINSWTAASLLQKALRQIDEGKRAVVVMRTLARAARIRPSYLLKNMRSVVRMRNVKRLGKLLALPLAGDRPDDFTAAAGPRD
jgi:hypothetical protein